ncbi:hypothetical protein M0Q28_06100 [Patescibacteria group bacterium]|nr:hypothetical protein [Patescibacteria group bacterium]
MKLSPGADGEPRSDFFVSIKVSDREVTPHMFRERSKSEYHVALYDWLLNGGDEPKLMAFGPDEWPARKLGAPVEAAKGGGVGVKPLEWEEFERGSGSVYAISIFGRYSAWREGEYGRYETPEGYRSRSIDGGIDAAKAAAQDHFEARIRSALTSPADATAECPRCHGRGYVSGDPEGAPIEGCDGCGGTGLTSPASGERDAVTEECAKVADGFVKHRPVFETEDEGGIKWANGGEEIPVLASDVAAALRMEGK